MNYPEKFTQRDNQTIIAGNRFGLGIRLQERRLIAKDPKAWLHNQISDYLTDIPTSPMRSPSLIKFATQAQQKNGKDLAEFRTKMLNSAQDRLLLQTEKSLTTPLPFIERWVGFWVEFFGLSHLDQRMFGLRDSLIDEVIRPLCFDPFHRLLSRMVAHPILLIYLGNNRILGPSAAFPQPQDQILAQTILKNYTLGESGESHRSNIFALSTILKPWQVYGYQHPKAGQFFFNQNLDAPKAIRFLGRIFPQSTHLRGEAALEMLTHSPKTAQNIATALARYFISDNPKPALIQALVNAYANSGGSLLAIAKKLIDTPESWHFRTEKVKSPADLTVSLLRALGLTGPEAATFALSGQIAMGQNPMRSPILFPWPAGAGIWLSQDQYQTRLSWQIEVLGWKPLLAFGAKDAFALLGPDIKPALFRRLIVSQSGHERALLTLTSPAFQRR